MGGLWLDSIFAQMNFESADFRACSLPTVIHHWQVVSFGLWRRFWPMGIVIPIRLAFTTTLFPSFVAIFALAFASRAAENPPSTISLTSSAFTNGAAIPEQYTCHGKNVSPPLKWSGVPSQAESLVLIMDDPDAPVGTWVHWVLYDLAPSTTELPEGFGAEGNPPADAAKQGKNDFKRLGYGGPCPPSGKPHRYFLKLYALDRVLNLKPGAIRKDVERAMEKHIIGQGQLVAIYKRK
jgi:Raf kinase inhibitor-like YbhB/YbcL family protein